MIISKIIAGILLVFLALSSCQNKNTTSDVGNETKVKELVADSSFDIQKQLLNLDKLKNDFDSFAITFKKTDLPFELYTDTIGVHSSDEQLWAFKKGIFELINPDSTELLVRHHFMIPKTNRILRLYLLEITYPSIVESNTFFKKLVSRKNYKAHLTEGYFLNFGLTGTTDYVLKSNETVLWFNLSCKYSKKEFSRLIEIFKKGVAVSKTDEVIKCYCQELCE